MVQEVNVHGRSAVAVEDTALEQAVKGVRDQEIVQNPLGQVVVNRNTLNLHVVVSPLLLDGGRGNRRGGHRHRTEGGSCQGTEHSHTLH